MFGEKGEFRTFRGYTLAEPEESLTASMEDYLEMAYRLSRRDGFTRVNDLARTLNVKPPSVTNMVQRLHKRGLIRSEKYGVVFLTSAGEELGRYLLHRHHMLEKFFSLIGVPGSLLENVEKIEHNLTAGATRRLALLVNFIEENPAWLQEFQDYCKVNLD